jgi:hypothetical protein
LDSGGALMVFNGQLAGAKLGFMLFVAMASL